MIDEQSLRALPRDTASYHERRAAHLRALAATATTARVKARLLRGAREHEDIAAGVVEVVSEGEE